jgi:hypothetical protein
LAPLGTAFTYQGRLTQTAQPVNGTCDFQFSVFGAASGGAALGSQNVNGVSVSDGLFTVLLDFGAGVFTGEARFLEIAVRCPSGAGGLTTLSPRQPLTPAPYALFANATGALRAVPVAAAAPTAGQVLQFDGTQWAPASLAGASPSWLLAGNAGTNPTTQFLGTTDNQPLNIRVNNVAGWRIEAGTGSCAPTCTPNIIGGFSGNSATGVNTHGSTIAGGGESGGPNTVSNIFTTVGGGRVNTASGPNATVSGGNGNTANGGNAVIAGGFANTASGEEASVGGGGSNRVTAFASTVAGGDSNAATAEGATVGGGTNNKATGAQSTIAGGDENEANKLTATVGGGSQNTAGGTSSFVGGGNFNVADGGGSAIAGGALNSAAGLNATVPGGSQNAAAGDNSLAAGQRAKANNDGSFVWADSQTFDFLSNPGFGVVDGDNTFHVRAGGGIRLLVGTQTCTLTSAVAGFQCAIVSTRDLKSQHALAEPRATLEALVAMPVAVWSYLADGDSVQHIGPMAQDFRSAFGMGESDKVINSVDAQGVAFAAIQGLYQIVKEKEAEIAALRGENAAQQERLDAQQAQADAQQARLADLEREIGELRDTKARQDALETRLAALEQRHAESGR